MIFPDQTDKGEDVLGINTAVLPRDSAEQCGLVNLKPDSNSASRKSALVLTPQLSL